MIKVFQNSQRSPSPEMDVGEAVVVLIMSLHHSFETVSLHSPGPPLSFCNGGAEALFEGWEDHPRLRGSRPGKGNISRFN